MIKTAYFRNYLSRHRVFILLLLVFSIRLFIYCDSLVANFSPFEGMSWGTCKLETKFSSFSFGEAGDNLIASIRKSAVTNIREQLPSPHSELLMGILVGTNDLSRVPRFNDVVRTTGTIHVIVVSGYSISLVFGLVISFVGSAYRVRNVFLALFITLIYAVISGFEPPVIRAWLMGCVAALSTYFGRKIHPNLALLFSALFILTFSPKYVFSLSFQLSFLATLGIVLYTEIFSFYIKQRFVLLQDLTTTLSAQLLVWPLISFTFEKVSLVSPLSNTLILWTVPISTVLGGVYLLLTYTSSTLSFYFSYLVMPFLDIFVRACYFFDSFKYASVTYKPSSTFMVIYYIVALSIPHFHNRRLRRRLN